MLSDVETALLTVTQNVGHYAALEQTDKYIVWAEDGSGVSSWSDNKRKAGSITGTVDYFTKTENDTNTALIEAAFKSIRISWRLNSVQYERDTGYIHFEWAWEMI